MWILLALLTAFLVATRDTIAKKLLGKDLHPLVLGGSLFTVSGILLAGVIAYTGAPAIRGGVYFAVVSSAALNVVATIFLLRSLKYGDISIVTPLLSFTSVFAVGTSYLMLGEKPTLLGAAGILLVVLGSYVLHWETFGEGVGTVFRRIRASRAGLYMLAVALIYSVSANLDKMASLRSSPVFTSVVLDLLLGLTLLALVPLMRNEVIFEWAAVRRHALWLVFLGALFAVTTWAHFTALTLEIVPYVSAVTRLSALFAVIFGIIYFGEKSGGWRLLGASIMIFGVVLIAL